MFEVNGFLIQLKLLGEKNEKLLHHTEPVKSSATGTHFVTLVFNLKNIFTYFFISTKTCALKILLSFL